MKFNMEFSFARSLQQFSVLQSVPFPHLSSQPSQDDVNPGIGQTVNLFETIVPMRGKSLLNIETKVDSLPEILSTTSSDQIGTGDKKMDPIVLNSFLHPIKTDSIVFEEEQKEKNPFGAATVPTPSRKRKSETDSKKKVPHKFKVV